MEEFIYSIRGYIHIHTHTYNENALWNIWARQLTGVCRLGNFRHDSATAKSERDYTPNLVEVLQTRDDLNASHIHGRLHLQFQTTAKIWGNICICSMVSMRYISERIEFFFSLRTLPRAIFCQWKIKKTIFVLSLKGPLGVSVFSN